jgi:hypothetical protein
LEQSGDFRGQTTYPLSSKMTPLVYEMDVSSSCGPEDADFMAFIEVTSLVGGRNAVEDFLTSGLWTLGQQFGFEVETKEYPLSKVIVLMPQITTAIGQWESEATFVARIEKAANELVGRIILPSIMPIKGFSMGGSITFLNWLELSVNLALSQLGVSARFNRLLRQQLRRQGKPPVNDGVVENWFVLKRRPPLKSLLWALETQHKVCFKIF